MKEKIKKIKELIEKEREDLRGFMKFYTKRNGTYTSEGSKIYTYRSNTIHKMQQILKIIEEEEWKNLKKVI